VTLGDINIRTNLQPGDLGYVIYMHGKMYKEEYNYGIEFETYVALGLYEFFQQYNSLKDRVWVCEHDNKIIGFLLLMHRDENTAQLRYFLIDSHYRGIGLGKKLMQLYMDFFKGCSYQSSYLWTTNELPAAASLYVKYGFTLTEEKLSASFGKEVKEQRYDLLSF